MAQYVVRLGVPITPGTVASARVGDLVRVHYDATARHDWGAMVPALMAAYVRGAALDMRGES